MKSMLIGVILILIPSLALAAKTPYLVCDAQAGVETYTVTDNGVAKEVTATPAGALDYSLAGIADGPHTVTVVPCNLWGCGAVATITFSVKRPGQSQNIKIIVR